MSNREYTKGEMAMARDIARDHVDLAGPSCHRTT